MAEFQEVMRQAKRMCAATVCEKCALGDVVGIICPIAVMPDDEVEKIVHIVMYWAAKNPEPRYPTFKEWIRELPRVGLSLNDPIPEDIAKALKLEKLR